jgi:hypothetical protein
VEADGQRTLERRTQDHVADRSGLVVDEAELCLERRVVERARAEQAHLLLGREEELDACVRASLLDDPARGLDHGDDRRLVVGAEDRPACVPDDAVLADDGLERALRRHRVEVRAEEDRRPASVATGQATEQVADRRIDLRAGVVLPDLEPERPQLGDHAVGDRTFLAGRARDRGELEEEVEHSPFHVRRRLTNVVKSTLRCRIQLLTSSCRRA